MSFDSEQARLVDRIRATAFYEAKQAGAEFITRKWVADKINRSENFVKRNWTKKPLFARHIIEKFEYCVF